jgi:glucose/arabinose dehydrogenase
LPGFTDTPVVSGLSQPTALAFLPSGNMLVTEKGGALVLAAGDTRSVLVTVPVCTDSEMGLLGVAVDPDFQSNGFVYLYRTKPGPDGCNSSVGRFNQVVRVKMVGDSVDPGTLTELLSGIRTDAGNHDGGGLRVGPDRKLYVSVGDAGLGDVDGLGLSTNPYAQDLGALEGKILRLELDGTPASGNPFLGQPGARGEIYAYGFRNPFRFGFDPVTGELWAGDVGQDSYDELDIVVAGGNYAWPRCEGTQPPGCELPGDVDPIFSDPLSGPDSLGRTIIGGSFAPAGFDSLDGGDYFFADWASSKIYRTEPNAARDDIATPDEFVTSADGPVDVVFGPDRSLYYIAFNSGEMRRVAPDAVYAQPGAANVLRVPLVPAFRECVAPNTTHSPPLESPSCEPPIQESPLLTTSTIGRGSGFLRLDVMPEDPFTFQDEADVAINGGVTDVRRASDGGDYQGVVLLEATLRITDTANGAFETTAATVQDVQFALPLDCVSTGDDATGSTCTINTTIDTLVPGFALEGQRAVIDALTVTLEDPGPDGSITGLGLCPPICGTGDERDFLVQGVFVP